MNLNKDSRCLASADLMCLLMVRFFYGCAEGIWVLKRCRLAGFYGFAELVFMLIA